MRVYVCAFACACACVRVRVRVRVRLCVGVAKRPFHLTLLYWTLQVGPMKRVRRHLSVYSGYQFVTCGNQAFIKGDLVNRVSNCISVGLEKAKIENSEVCDFYI